MRLSDLELAMKNCELVLSSKSIFATNIMKTKTSSDAFFAYLFVILYMDEDTIRGMLEDAHNRVSSEVIKRWHDWEVYLLMCDLLQKIRGMDFYGDTTFTSTGEIAKYVRDHRKQTGVRMGGTVVGMPCSVLEVLVDFMAGDARDFFRVAFRLPDDPESNPARAHDTRQDLCSMALVHRSWTQSCQRVLRRRVIFRSFVAVRNFLLNPHCGPWVREWAFAPRSSGDIDSDSDGSDDDLTEYDFGDCSRPFTLNNSPWLDLQMLLSCTPNVRRLSLSLPNRTFPYSEVYCRKNKGIGDFIRFLGELKHLEACQIRSLDLYDSSPNEMHFTEFAEQLSKLPKLRTLSIQGFLRTDNKPNHYPERLNKPSHNIANLQLENLVMHISDKPRLQNPWSLGRIVQQSQETLQRLLLHFYVPAGADDRACFVNRAKIIFPPTIRFPNLRCFRMAYGDASDRAEEGGLARTVLSVLQYSTNLSTLKLDFTCLPAFPLPSSVEVITLTFDYNWLAMQLVSLEQWTESTAELLSLNEGCNRLQKLTITFVSDGSSDQPLSEEEYGLKASFETARTFCEERHVSLDFTFEIVGLRDLDVDIGRFLAAA